MTMCTFEIPALELSKGMFIQSIYGKRSTAFPARGLLIESDEQLTTLKTMCSIAIIDLTRSNDAVYQQWNTAYNTNTQQNTHNNTNTMTLIEPISFAHVATTQHNNAKLNTPHYNQTIDRYGYQGRLVYRVLENKLIAMMHREEIDLDILFRDISDFIAYTSINPDLLLLESHLSKHAYTLVGLGIRSIVHICNYGKSFNKNDSFLQPIALSIMAFMAVLHRLPKHASQPILKQDLANNTILAHAIHRQLNLLEHHYNFPLNVKKTLLQICERVDGAGPQRLSGTKITQQSQLIKMAFTFEYLQSFNVYTIPATASEAITTLRTIGKDIISTVLFDKFTKTLPLFPTGTLVNINRSIALVTRQHPLRKLSPKILAIADHTGNPFNTIEWINSEVSLGSIKQSTKHKTTSYDALIREALESKKPWYHRIINFDTIRGWLQRIHLAG